jgi:hypothetical protein
VRDRVRTTKRQVGTCAHAAWAMETSPFLFSITHPARLICSKLGFYLIVFTPASPSSWGLIWMAKCIVVDYLTCILFRNSKPRSSPHTRHNRCGVYICKSKQTNKQTLQCCHSLIICHMGPFIREPPIGQSVPTPLKHSVVAAP